MFETKVREIIADKLGVPVEDLNDDDDLLDDLGASSLDAVEIVMDIEDALGITIEDSQIIECRHIGEICEMIGKLYKEA